MHTLVDVLQGPSPTVLRGYPQSVSSARKKHNRKCLGDYISLKMYSALMHAIYPTWLGQQVNE